MAFDLNAFLEDVFKGVNVDKSALATQLGDPQVIQRLEQHVMRQSDYSRHMADLQKRIDDATNYYNQLNDYKTKVDSELSTYKTQADTYRKALADNGIDPVGLTPHVDPALQRQDNANYMSKEEWQKAAQDMQTQGVSLMARMAKLSTQHMQRFKDVLDTEELVNLAMKKNVPIDVAYELQIAPLVEKEREAELKRIKEEAFKEGEKAALAKATFPADTRPDYGRSSALDFLEKPDAQKLGWQSAVEAHSKELFTTR